MKILLLIALISIGLTSFAQQPTRAQVKKFKILTNYIWRNADSSGSTQAPAQLIFSDEKDLKDGYKGSFKLSLRTYVMDWEWANKKATSLTLYLRYSSMSLDTLRLTNVRLTDKLLTADFTFTNWGKPKTGTMRQFAAKTKEEANNEPIKLKATEIDR